MNYVFICIIVATLICLFFKFALKRYKPYLLSKNLENVDVMYEQTINHFNKRIDSIKNDFKDFHSGDKMTASSKETFVILEENERRLDMLLAEQNK